MARIVYTWELGGDYGHIHSFMPLALTLREAGHEVVFVIRDLSNAENLIGKHGFAVMQAPIWLHQPSETEKQPISYSEIIMRYGFQSKTTLSGLNRAWLALFSLLKPSIVIADHSPVALFAAYAVGIPRALFGTGFCSPPHIAPLPNMRPWSKAPPELLIKADAHVINVMNGLLSDMNSKAQPFASVADLFKVQLDLLCTFPEIDHYPQRQEAQYWGAVFNNQQGKCVSWPSVDEANKDRRKRIFAYLKPQYRYFEKVLAALKKSGHNVRIFSPRIKPETIAKYQTAHMQFVIEPIKLDGLLEHCDLTVCHAGHGTLAASLMAGVPLLLLPTQLEQFLASLRVRELGAAELVDLEVKKPVDFELLLKALLENSSYQQKAQLFAKKYHDFYAANPFVAMVNQVNKVIEAANAKKVKQ